MRPLRWLSCCLVIGVACTAPATPAFQRIMDDWWAMELAADPLRATGVGEHRYDDQLPLVSVDSLKALTERRRAILGKLSTINRTKLTAADRVSLDMMAEEIGTSIKEFEFGTWQMPILADDGFHMGFARLPNDVPLNTIKDYDNYLSRLTKYPRYSAENVANMREGIRTRFTMPAVVLTGYDRTIAAHVVDDVTKSVFWQPFLKMPTTVAPADQERLRSERGTGFKGSFADFLRFLRTDPQFYAKTPAELLKEASALAKGIDGKLPAVFGKLPRQPYTVAPVPDDIAPKYTGGRYVGAPIDGTRPGTYWVNTYNLPSRPLYVLPALTLHEAVPGHHLQSALSKELIDLPAFRRHTYINAFGEGWGLYSEFLGIEAGIYRTPYTRFGRLTYEMWRACRLVVDTGIHWKGWTRDHALAFLASNTALSLHEVATETDRYIAWPGQALAYKLGELKFRELRKEAEKALGTRFDLRAFHDVVLRHGTVPLAVLADEVHHYIAEQSAPGAH